MTADTRPNIIFIVVDDCGYADLGCTGQTHYATPALDRMAAEGVRFTQAYANASLCTNTRVALMTGRYQYRCNLGLVEPLRWVQREMPEMGLPPEVPTLPGMLRAAGYATALIGKWHLGYLPRYSPLRSGYDAFFGIMGGFAGYYTHIGDSGERELDRNQLVDGGSIRIYAEMMEILDRGIGAVLEAVRAGSGRETLVLFTSDNGGERYSKIWPFVGRKFDLLEGGLRVPQIAWWPGRIAPGWVSDQVTITMDLTATCLEAGGARIDPAWPLDGESLLPHLIAGAPPRERTLYWRMANRAQRALRRGDMKYLKVNAQEFLFDLGFDERERDNLAAKQPGLLAELRAAWEAWDATMLPLKDFGPVSSPSRMGDMLW